MLAAMAIAAALCIGIGVLPGPLYELLPFPQTAAKFVPYDMTHIVTQCQLLLFAILAFVFLQKFGLYPAEIPSTNIGPEWVYRRGGPRATRRVVAACSAVWSAFRGWVDRHVERDLWLIRNLHRPGQGSLGEPWPIGEAALWAAGLLAALLVMTQL